MDICHSLFKLNRCVLGLTGTLASSTRNSLYNSLKLPVVGVYSMEQAIADGIVTDYEIFVVKVPLDNTKAIYLGKTEKGKFDNISWVINKLEEEEKDTFFMRLARMRIIQNSIAKLNKTKSILASNKDERILTFCGTTKIADSLGVASFHSKSIEKALFEDFVVGKINHLAVCKLGNSGVTYKSLSRVIINYFSSNSEELSQRINRCMSMEYDTPGKKAHIYIISTTEPVEQKWLKRALEFFSQEKIKYL